MRNNTISNCFISPTISIRNSIPLYTVSSITFTKQIARRHQLKYKRSALLTICSELRTCRNCKQTFESAENNPTACRYHHSYYTGDSKRKGEWNSKYESGSGSAERFWWCCGETDLNAPGCQISAHKTYDDY